MKTIPPLFENIPMGQMSESPCIPEINDWDYRGIELNAPSKVIISDEFALPLCGAWQFSYKFINKFRRIHNEIVIVVTDTVTYKSYSGNLEKPGYERQDYKKAVGTDEELEMNTASSRFNIDVFDYVRSLPEKTGKYSIYAIIGDVKSNVVEVELEIEKGAAPGPRKPRPQ